MQNRSCSRRADGPRADRRGVDMGPSAIRYGGLADQCRIRHRLHRRRRHRCAATGGARPRCRWSGQWAREVLSERQKKFCEDVTTAVDASLRGDGSRSRWVATTPSASDRRWCSPRGRRAGRHLVRRARRLQHAGDDTRRDSRDVAAAVLGLGAFSGREWANAAGLKEENVAIVGLRSVDDAEAEAIRDSDVTVYTMSDIDERGARGDDDALDVATDGTDGSTSARPRLARPAARPPASGRRSAAA